MLDAMKDSSSRGSHGILAVCDGTRPEALLNMQGRRESVENVAGSIPACVLANKVDFVDKTRREESEVESLCQGWGSPYLLTSAKTRENVKEALAGLALKILKSQLEVAQGVGRGGPRAGP